MFHLYVENLPNARNNFQNGFSVYVYITRFLCTSFYFHQSNWYFFILPNYFIEMHFKNTFSLVWQLAWYFDTFLKLRKRNCVRKFQVLDCPWNINYIENGIYTDRSKANAQCLTQFLSFLQLSYYTLSIPEHNTKSFFCVNF